MPVFVAVSRVAVVGFPFAVRLDVHIAVCARKGLLALGTECGELPDGSLFLGEFVPWSWKAPLKRSHSFFLSLSLTLPQEEWLEEKKTEFQWCRCSAFIESAQMQGTPSHLIALFNIYYKI